LPLGTRSITLHLSSFWHETKMTHNWLLYLRDSLVYVLHVMYVLSSSAKILPTHPCCLTIRASCQKKINYTLRVYELYRTTHFKTAMASGVKPCKNSKE